MGIILCTIFRQSTCAITICADVAPHRAHLSPSFESGSAWNELAAAAALCLPRRAERLIHVLHACAADHGRPVCMALVVPSRLPSRFGPFVDLLLTRSAA
jgi:hypothetical protein